ncbi:MAG: hypothetical protein HY215_00895 [Candidatus Rokubacteria bacterium]|nr:hypothetical protein [Candidatus Rokubacteria bacterium]
MATGIGRSVSLFLLAVTLGASGCVSFREVVGLPAESAPTANQKRATQKWVLIQNPRFGSVSSEPEYIWVEEDRIPSSINTLMFGKKSVLAPPDLVARYGPPPGGGKISPLQDPSYVPPAARGPARGRLKASDGVEEYVEPPRGYVVYVDTTRIVVDLTAKDGVRPGTLVSLRRDKFPIVHPVTGEVLGELDEEVATAKVVDVREKFSVAEIESISPGMQIKLKDRVVPR